MGFSFKCKHSRINQQIGKKYANAFSFPHSKSIEKKMGNALCWVCSYVIFSLQWIERIQKVNSISSENATDNTKYFE